VVDVAFHPSVDLAFTCSHDKTAKVWSYEPSTGNYSLAHTLTGHEGPVSQCSIHPSGEYLATASEDSTWGFYDLSTAALLKRIPLYSDGSASPEALCIKFHPDGAIFGTGSKDNLIRIWDVNSQNNVATFQGHTGQVNTLSFSENGYHMVSGGHDGIVKFWDLRKLKSFIDINLSNNGPVHEVHFEYNGTYLGVASSDVRIYKEMGKRNWELVQTFSDHKAAVTGVKIAPELAFVASTSMDRSLKIYS